MEQACDPGGVRCSEHFADLLTRRAPPNEFLLEAAAGPGQSDKISHIDMGDDRIDAVISHIDLPYRYWIISCHSGPGSRYCSPCHRHAIITLFIELDGIL